MADSVAEARRQTRAAQREDESRIDRQTDKQTGRQNGRSTEMHQDENNGKKTYVETLMTDTSGTWRDNSNQGGGKERQGLPTAGFRLRYRKAKNIDKG